MYKATVQTGLGRVPVLLVKDQVNMLTSHTPTPTPVEVEGDQDV
jgi:hypothetical protein